MRLVICYISLLATGFALVGCGQSGALQLPNDQNYDKRSKYLLYPNVDSKKQSEPKEAALDLCSGCGIVSLAWHDAGHRGPCTAVELDADASALCRRAVQETPGAEHITALCTDLRTFCKSGPEQGKYDFAACNPPYFTGGYVSPDARRATARHDGSCTMQDVAACAARALHDGGKLALCHRPEQMAAVFAALCAVGLEPKRVALVRKDEHSKPWLFLVEAQKGRKPGIRWEEDVLTGNGVRYGR